MQRCWVNFQCRGVLLICMIVRQGPTALAVGAGGGYLDIFTLIYPFSSPYPSLWEMARYRLKYCLKGPLNPNQPTNQCKIIATCVSLDLSFAPLAATYTSICLFHFLKFSEMFPSTISSSPGGLNIIPSAMIIEFNADLVSYRVTVT